MKINFFTAADKKYPRHLQKIEYRSTVDNHPDWCFYLPPENPPSSVCIVVLHGFDGHGSQLYLRPNLRRYCLPEYMKRNFHILTPELRGNAWMNPQAMRDLEDLLNFFRQQLGIRTVILDSGSMGAVSNLFFAVSHPDMIQAVIARGAVPDLADYYSYCLNSGSQLPMLSDIAASIRQSYGGTPEEQPVLYRSRSPLASYRCLADLPFFLCHGDCDELMPVEGARRLAAACASFPGFRYHEIPGGDHESPLHLTSVPFDWIGRFLPELQTTA